MEEEQLSLAIDKKAQAQQRRERLSRPHEKTRKTHNRSYSLFVRWMRLVLPLAALGIVALLFTWSNLQEETALPVQEQAEARTIGKNELVNPRFESTDEKKQPYTITARRAIQGESNEDLIILEKPVADMILNNGSWVAIEADKGAYRQDVQRLLLQGNVRLFHDRGYQMETARLHVNLDENYAWSEMDIYGQGPAGTLEAKGLKANNKTGHLIFMGPARLVLNRSISELN